MVLQFTRSASGSDGDRKSYYTSKDEVYLVPDEKPHPLPKSAMSSGSYEVRRIDYNNNNRPDYVSHAYPRESNSLKNIRRQFYSMFKVPRPKEKIR